jgi:hypothetical protein
MKRIYVTSRTSNCITAKQFTALHLWLISNVLTASILDLINTYGRGPSSTQHAVRAGPQTSVCSSFDHRHLRKSSL